MLRKLHLGVGGLVLGLAIGAVACGSNSAAPAPSRESKVLDNSCSCVGTGPGGVAVTAACGETACGEDENTYICSASGFSLASTGCPSADAGADSGCTCSGTGPGGVPVTAACGEAACGEDHNTYVCSASGFSLASTGCPSADAGCTCSGTGPGGVPVTAACGDSACGEDENTYVCSASGFTIESLGCSSPDAGTDSGCACSGTGPGGVPVTAACGQTACGEDGNMYLCGDGGFTLTSGEGCPLPDGGPGSCTCTAAGLDSVVTVTCGEEACGNDNNTYACTADGLAFLSAGCCSCTGTGPGGVAVTAACGEMTCGEDNNTYLCTDGGMVFASAGCCECAPNLDIAGKVSVTTECGQTACGADGNTYFCASTAFPPTAPFFIPPTQYERASDGCTGAIPTCACSGIGPNGVPLLVLCGAEAIGEDGNRLFCFATGFSEDIGP